MSDLANLGAEDYHRVAVDLLPTGMAWPRDPDAVAVRAWAGPAAGLARHHARVMDLLDVEADPRSTLLLLPDWERNAGLPDECTGPAETLEGRRLRLVQQLTARGGQSPSFFTALAEGLGFAGTTVTEFRPFLCTSECDDSLDPDPWRFAWRLNVPADDGAGVRSFTAGSACTEALRTWGAAVLECVVLWLQPAHGHVLFAYSYPYVLDFSAISSLPAEVTFSRSSVGTYFDGGGVLRTAAAGEPRFDHDPLTGAARGLLIEEARTNLLSYSEQFDNAAWAKTRLTVVPNAAVGPDGTMSMDKLVPSIDANTHSIGPAAIPASDGQTVTWSVYAKAGEYRYLRLRNGTNLGFVSAILIDLTTGLLAEGVGTPYTVTPVGGGIYRITTTATLPTGGVTAFAPSLWVYDNDQNPTGAGDGTSGLYVWGAQVEAGTFPTTYIPTEGAAVTRAAETASLPVSAVPGWDPSQGALYVEASTFQPPTGYAVTNDRAHLVTLGSGGGNSLEAFIYAGGVACLSRRDGGAPSAAGPALGGAPAVDQIITLAVAYGYDTADLAVSGTLATSLPRPFNGGAASTVTIGDGGIVTGRNLNGHVRNVTIYPRRLSAAKLQEITQ